MPGAQVLGSPFFIGVTSEGGVQQQESAATQQDRDTADVYPGSISGETRFFPEFRESGDSGGSGCSEAIPETLAAEEQERMYVAGGQMLDPANVMIYEEFVRMQQERDRGPASSWKRLKTGWWQVFQKDTISGEAVELSEMD